MKPCWWEHALRWTFDNGPYRFAYSKFNHLHYKGGQVRWYIPIAVLN